MHTLISQEEGSIPLPAYAEPHAGPCNWLISLDYDGTLRVEDEQMVQPEFFELVRGLRSQGVRWGINTGRSLRKLAGELEHFPTMPDFICTCERYAYLADESGALHPAAAHNTHCHQANRELKEALLPAWQALLTTLRQMLPTCRWELAADDPLSIEAADSATMDILMPHISPFAMGNVAIQRAGRFMRLSDARFTKGSALLCVCQAWQVPAERLFLMGDGHNDIDAFRQFPQAWCAAPSSAHPDVIDWLQAHGGYISTETGVLQALRHWASLRGMIPPC